MVGWSGIFIFLGLLMLSINERSRRLSKHHRKASLSGQEMPIHNSPLAEAITHTVGIAGGIYIAIVTTVSFLRMNVPETFYIMGLTLDPIAAIAFAITILQPFAMTLQEKFFK